MTSRQLIIPGEDPADLQELHRQWHDLYPTDNPVAERAVGRAADSEWLLMRVERGADQMDANLFQQPMAHWSAKDHADYALSQRYTTAKRRELERDRRAIAQHRREARHDARDAAAAAKSKVDEVEAQRLLPKKDPPLLQRVTVSAAEGKTKTVLNPTNDQLLVTVERSYDNAVVLRTISIKADPLPPEYAWTAATVARETDGHVHYWADLESHDGPILEKLGIFAPAK